MPTYEAVLEAFSSAKSELAEILSAFEFFDSKSKQLVLHHRTDLRNPLPETSSAEFYCLIETQGSNAKHDMEKLETYLGSLIETGVCLDGALAQDSGQIQAMWGVREGIPEACSKDGAVYKV
jgi:FAD/FMN-containing dehydrogenase